MHKPSKMGKQKTTRKPDGIVLFVTSMQDMQIMKAAEGEARKDEVKVCKKNW